MRFTFASRAATRTFSVPSILIRFVSMGSLTDLGTEVRAARCSTYSASCMALRTTSMSVMLPLIKVILLRISARFSSLPEERSSSTTTLCPRRTSSSTVFEPIKPAPPVTTKRIPAILLHQVRSRQVAAAVSDARLKGGRLAFLIIFERRNFLGKTAGLLKAFARTKNPLRMMFEFDDQFDSYSDVATL